MHIQPYVRHVSANQRSNHDVTDDVMALEYEHRPLIGCQNSSSFFHLNKKKNVHIKVCFMRSVIDY